MATTARKYYHSCVSLDYLSEHLGAFSCSQNEARQAIAEARAEGYGFWPNCDNIDSRGHCAGHEKIDERR